MSLNKKQKQALDMLKKGNNTFLSGEAGTGKSYVIQQFKAYLDRNNKKYVVCAPTGLAALNVGGTTLHRTFGLSISPLDWHATMKNVAEAEVIIIDEISMCRVDTFQKIARAIFAYQARPEIYDAEEEARIVRKKQVVVVGDFFQLPPVLTDKDAEILKLSQEQAYPFECKEWNMFNFKNIVLDEVVRQSDKDFINNLNRVRRGDAAGLEFIEKKSKKTKIKKAIYLCSKNADADKVNNSNLKTLKGKEYIYWADETGEVKEEDRATKSRLVLKAGARVMCLVNASKEVANGMIGTITQLNKEKVEVEFDNGVYHSFEKYKWGIKGFKKEIVDGKEKIKSDEIGTFTQIPLKLAWAITIHKSQGQTYEAVNLNPNCFCSGQLYVALSRCKELKKIHLTESLHPSYLKVSEAVKRFYSKIEVLMPKASEPVIEEKKEFITMSVPKEFENTILEIIRTGNTSYLDQSIQDELKLLKNENKKLKKEIAEIKEKRSRAGRKRECSNEAIKKVFELKEQGLSIRKIAAEVGVGSTLVHRILTDESYSKEVQMHT